MVESLVKRQKTWPLFWKISSQISGEVVEWNIYFIWSWSVSIWIWLSNLTANYQILRFQIADRCYFLLHHVSTPNIKLHMRNVLRLKSIANKKSIREVHQDIWLLVWKVKRGFCVVFGARIVTKLKRAY